MNLPEDFNLLSYRLLNNDLKNLNDDELTNHYLIYGINEERRYKYNLPDDFDLNSYRILNSDLNQFNDQELLSHYLISGTNEGRSYKYNLPDDFDLNSDLNQFNDQELLDHYLTKGIKEERMYKYNFQNNSSFIYLSKIKKFNFKLNKDFIIKIYLSEYIKLYYSKIVDIIKDIIKNIKIIDYFDKDTDIVLYTYHDNIDLNNLNINICVNGENKDCQELTDIAILSRKKYDYKYNIYFPQLFTSLWERKKDYYIIKNNTREYFCAYMYSYNIEYRVEIYNFISTYKKVDALGKSCNNDDFQDDRNTYNDSETYNDIAIEKYLKYKFVLALENTIYNGYITEKLINPILANSIPIYAGPKDAFEIINKKRVIYVYDFSNYNDLLDYIINVDNDSDLYNSIISEDIFIGNINFNNFEEYLLLQFKKALGLTSKNILLCNNELINYNNYDFIIKNFNIQSNDIKLIKRYLNDYINEDDNIVLNYYNNINYINNIFFGLT